MSSLIHDAEEEAELQRQKEEDNRLEEEMDNNPPILQVPIESVPVVITKPEEPAEPVDILSEIEIRLQKAFSYKQFLNHPILKKSDDPISNDIKKEIREFILDRMGVLMGVKKEKTPQVVIESNPQHNPMQRLVQVADQNGRMIMMNTAGQVGMQNALPMPSEDMMVAMASADAERNAGAGLSIVQTTITSNGEVR